MKYSLLLYEISKIRSETLVFVNLYEKRLLSLMRPMLRSRMMLMRLRLLPYYVCTVQ
jgi:hypothetical protein